MARNQRKQPRRQRKTSFDSLLKTWAGEYALDLATFVMGERPRQVLQADTCLATASQRLTDKLLDLRFPRRPGVLLHLEFQAGSSYKVRERFAVYLALIQPVLRRPEHRGKTFAAAVIYLDKKRFRGDSGVLDRVGAWGTRLFASYRVIKLWEVSPDLIRHSRRPGLLPLLPLTAGNPVDLLVESKQRIVALNRFAAETRSLLLTLTLGLARLRIQDDRIIKRFAMEFHLTGKNTILDVFREEGQEIGQITQSRRDILRVLTRRFGALPSDIPRMVERIAKLRSLDSLLDKALVAPTLEDFQRRLRARKG